jgi:hypothetical protein
MTNSCAGLETLRKLFIQGRYQELLDFASKNSSLLLATDEAARLIGQVRTEVCAQQQRDLLDQVNTTLGCLSASVHQLLVTRLLSSPRFDDRRRLEPFGFSAGSQNEEDGILVEIFRRIGCPYKTFMELGVNTGLHSCTLYFLLAGWRGGWVGMNSRKVEFTRQKFAFYIASDILRVSDRSVTPENVDCVAGELGVAERLDLLSLQLGGNDYFIVQEMTLKPRVLVVGYNGLYPPPHRIVQAYDPNYVRTLDTYTGCSLQSLVELARVKGYRLVGTNLTGLNAFFVREDLYSGEVFSDADLSDLYNSPRYQLGGGGAFVSGPQPTVSPLDEPPSLR